MIALEARDIVAEEKEWCTVWRRPGLVVVRLSGLIDDAKSSAWRVLLSQEIKRRGHPRFVAFEMYDADPQGGMASRVQVVTYVRELMRHSEWAVLLVPRAMSASLAVRLVARISGVSTVSVVTTRAEFSRIVEGMNAGLVPRS